MLGSEVQKFRTIKGRKIGLIFLIPKYEYINYINVSLLLKKSLKQMNVSPPTSEQKLIIQNMCLEFGFSIQTHHNTISILMNENLPQNANHDIDVILAALFISHKMHDTHFVGIESLCPFGINEETVLGMQQMILRQLKFKVYHELLIDEVLILAHQWDRFVQKLTCVDVYFYKQNSLFSREMLFELVEKMIFVQQLKKYEIKKIAMAIVYLCLKETMKKKDKKKAFKRIKLTDYIFDDFLKELTQEELSFQKIAKQIKVVKDKCFVLKESTNIHNNVRQNSGSNKTKHNQDKKFTF